MSGMIRISLIAKRAVLFVLVVACIYMTFYYAPPEEKLGDLYRIIYFHIPLAWVSYLAFTVTLFSGIIYLRKEDSRFDLISENSAGLGLLFCTLALITGAIFSKNTWNAYWSWDARQTTTLVLWMLYAAYLVLRNSIEDLGRRARISAVYSIIAFLGIPLSYFSVKIWFSLHPVITLSSPRMIHTLIVSVVAFTGIYLYMLLISYRLRKIEYRELK